MLFLILGILLLIASATLLKAHPAYARFKNTGRMIGLAFILIGVLLMSVVQINPGEIGIKILFGNIQPDVLGSGLHLVNPLLEIQKIDVKTQNYTMSGINDEGNKLGDDA